MISIKKNIREAFSGVCTEAERDRGDVVQTVILVAGFAVASFLLINWLTTAVLNKGADVAGCIEGSNTFKSGSSVANCQSQNNAAGGNSFKSKDSTYGDYFKK